MIAVDTNVLVHAFREEMPKHAAALRALTELAERHEAWAIPVFVIGEFVRVVTHSSVFDPPSSLAAVRNCIEALLDSPSARLLLPSERYWPLLADACEDADARGNLVFDAQIVALCKEHGVGQILSEDRGLRRFSGITVRHLD